MAGRRERQKQDRERRILRAAKALFSRRGYAGTGMGEIAQRARLAVGTLYNYFPSKTDLLAALLREDTAEVLAAGEALVKEAPDDPAEALAELLEVYAAPVRRHERELWRQLLAAALTGPASLARATLESDLRLVAQTTQLLEELQRRGSVRADVEPGPAAIAVYSIYITWLMAWIASDTISFDALRDQLHAGIRVLVRGLASPPHAPGREDRAGSRSGDR